MKYFFKIFFTLLIYPLFLNMAIAKTNSPNQPFDSNKIKKQETTRTWFNSNGNITSVKNYNSNDSLTSFTINKYNKNNLLCQSFDYFSNGKQKSKNKILYDKLDSLKTYEEKVSYAETGGISSSSSYYYNEKGLLNRIVNCSYEFKTDDKIQCDTSELSETKLNNGLTSQTLNNYKYFGTKNQMKIITTHDTIKHIDETSTYYNDTLSGKSTVEYNSLGIIIKTSNYSANGLLMYYTVYSENKAGNITISQSYNQNNVLTDKTLIIRDKRKNPIKILSYDGNETLTYKEEYDYKYTKKDKYSEMEVVKYY